MIIKAILTRFRKEEIHIDVILPDMIWCKDGGYGTRFDEQNFLNMKEFLSWTNNNGVHVGFNHHPGVLIPKDPRSQIFTIKTRLNSKDLLEK